MVLLVPELVKLKYLNELYLYLSPDELPKDTDQLNSMQPLCGVTDLKIEVYKLKNEQFTFWIGSLFPNLQNLIIKTEVEGRERICFQEQCLTTSVFPKLTDWRFAF